MNSMMFKLPPRRKIGTCICLQGDRFNMSLFSGTLEKVTCPVQTCTVANTGRVTSYKVPETRLCLTVHPLYRGLMVSQQGRIVRFAGSQK